MKLLNNLLIIESGDKKKLPIVFVHGFPFDHSMWEKQIEYLQTDYYCITYDIRGLGKSSTDDGQFTMESFVEDLFNIIDELNLHKPVVCGLSMGGYIVLRAVEREQQKFGGLILCDTKSAADTNDAKLKRAAGIKKINEEGVEKFISDFIPVCFAAETIENQKELFKNVLNRSLKFDATGLKGCLLAMQGRTDTTDFLEKIEIPTLLLCGTFDTFTPTSVMIEMTGKIRSSEFFEVPHAGHISPLENPEYVNEVIGSFFKRRIIK